MKFIVSLVLTFFAAVAMIAAGIPDRWLYPGCLVIFVLLVIMMYGSGEQVQL